MSLIPIRPVYINGWLTKYMVSNTGKIFRIKKNGVLKELKTRIDKDGYIVISLYLNGIAHYGGVHRYVARAFVINDDPANKTEVNHKNGIKDDNRFTNLEWVTPKENIHHAWDHGLASAKYCDDHPNSRYTNEAVNNVCQCLVDNKLTMREISEKTHVSYTVVKQIRNHIIWNKISSKYDFSHYNMSGRCKHKK